MITAPDVFTTDSDGTYTADVAVEWIAHHGTPSPLYIGRTFRYTPESGWEFGPATADAKPEWKPLDEAPKTLRTALLALGELSEAAEGFEPDRPGLYEFIGPKLARNPHGLDHTRLVRHGLVRPDEAADFAGVATTSLWALARSWFRAHDYQGILWTWDNGTDAATQHAAVRRAHLPQLAS